MTRNQTEREEVAEFAAWVTSAYFFGDREFDAEGTADDERDAVMTDDATFERWKAWWDRAEGNPHTFEYDLSYGYHLHLAGNVSDPAGFPSKKTRTGSSASATAILTTDYYPVPRPVVRH